jgi:hypothetical protein
MEEREDAMGSRLYGKLADALHLQQRRHGQVFHETVSAFLFGLAQLPAGFFLRP